MVNIKLISVIIIMLCLASCASLEQMHQEWLVKHCVSAAAYNKGMTDGLTPGIVPEPDYASECLVNNDVINTAYLKGFREGVKSRPQQININENVNLTNTNKQATL